MFHLYHDKYMYLNHLFLHQQPQFFHPQQLLTLYISHVNQLFINSLHKYHFLNLHLLIYPLQFHSHTHQNHSLYHHLIYLHIYLLLSFIQLHQWSINHHYYRLQKNCLLIYRLDRLRYFFHKRCS